MIETTHKGYTLRMSEESEAWCCDDLEIGFAAMLGLKACKDRIDSMLKEGRKLGDLKVLRLEGGAGRFNDHVKIIEVTATLLCAPKKRYGREEEEIEHCWVTDTKGERIKCSIKGLYPIEVKEAVEAWRKLVVASEQAIKLADAAEAALPAFKTADALMKAAREAKVAKAEADA